MTDPFEDCLTKKHSVKKHHGHGKKNLKSKFTSGLRNIFHHSKPVRRVASVPSGMHLSDPVHLRDPLHLSDPVEALGVYSMHRTSVDIDITGPNDIASKSQYHLNNKGLSHLEGRPASACFGYPVGTRNGSLPMGMGHLLPFPPQQNKKLDEYHRNDTIRAGGNTSRHDISKNNSIYNDTTSNDIDAATKSDVVDANNNIKKVSTSDMDVLVRTSGLGIDGSDESNERLEINNNTDLYSIKGDSNKQLKNELTSPSLSNNTNCDKIEKVELHTTSTSNSNSAGNNDSSRKEKSLVSPGGSTVSSSSRMIKQKTIRDSAPITSTPSSTPSSTKTPITRRNTVDWNDRNQRLRRPVTRSLSQSGQPRILTSRSMSGTSDLACVLDKNTLQTVIQDVIQVLLVDKKYNEKLVTRWCKDICVKVRDRLLRINELRHKVVVNTHIAAKFPNESDEDTIHVATRCEADATNDRFVTVALEGEDLYVWVTVFLLQY